MQIWCKHVCTVEKGKTHFLHILFHIEKTFCGTLFNFVFITNFHILQRVRNRKNEKKNHVSHRKKCIRTDIVRYMRNLTQSIISITSYMNHRHLMCISGLSIIHPHNSCCYHCVTLTSPCTCMGVL